MKKLHLLIIVCLIQTCLFAQSNQFNTKPWENSSYPIIIDPYQANFIDFEKLVTDPRVKSIIHKASQGLQPDAKYNSRNAAATAKNILFASYHLGTNTDPVKQADFYLSIIKNNPTQPTALDIEDIGGNNISLKDAVIFINRIYEKTKHYPLVYVNNKVFNAINAGFDKTSVFAKCPLWYARFLKSLPVLSNKVWDKVTLWQFSCEVNCTATGKCWYNVPGTRYDMDINVFNGSADDLKAFWNSYTTRELPQ